MSDPKPTREEIQALRLQHTVAMRDLAMRFLDDPIDADDVAYVAFRLLRDAKASDVGTGLQAEEWLRRRVVGLCAACSRRRRKAA